MPNQGPPESQHGNTITENLGTCKLRLVGVKIEKTVENGSVRAQVMAHVKHVTISARTNGMCTREPSRCLLMSGKHMSIQQMAEPTR